jgi:choline dehydrogenase-like flavoprotein
LSKLRALDAAELAEIEDRHWDAVIVGTGVGGATLGYALAAAGWSVLFCEKGESNLNHSLRGDYAERFFSYAQTPQPKHSEILRRAGRCFEEIDDLSNAKPRHFIPFIGAGTGGSSALYGMALERFLPADFTPGKYYPNAADSTLPESWPISYADLAPYYAASESLYRVRGGVDPLRKCGARQYQQTPPSLSLVAQEFIDFFKKQGLHPYRLPLACDFAPGCQGCQGYLCPRKCKIDSVQACIVPARDKYGAQMLGGCEASRLETQGDLVSAVVCRWRGQELRLRGRIIALAAGALASPALLLRSASPEWPDGLANGSGWVGKNLMRHYVDLYAVFPTTRHTIAGNSKEIAWSDFYLREGEKLGSFQSFGAMPPAHVMVESMQQDIRDKLGAWTAAAIGPMKPLLRPLMTQLFSRAVVFATIMEDLPYLSNKVFIPREHGDNARLAMNYRIHASEATRITALRRQVRAVLKPYRFLLFKQAENNQRLAHVCGTCRFGLHPHDSVLDANNKAHGLANLYVVDASFFPSSGGTNPALTIAANALRVAAHLIGGALSAR